MLLQVTFVGPGFTRKPPKYERFIRPTGESLGAQDSGFTAQGAGARQSRAAANAPTAAVPDFFSWVQSVPLQNGTEQTPQNLSRCSRAAGLRMNKAHVTHPELKATFHLDILGVKKNPNGAMYSSLGVITKGGLGRTCLMLFARLLLAGMLAACARGLCHGPCTQACTAWRCRASGCEALLA